MKIASTYSLSSTAFAVAASAADAEGVNKAAARTAAARSAALMTLKFSAAGFNEENLNSGVSRLWFAQQLEKNAPKARSGGIHQQRDLQPGRLRQKTQQG
jgi:hypothetical protein